MEIKKVYRFLSLDIWGGLPSYAQKKISSVYTKLYSLPVSKYFIAPYSKVQYPDPRYLQKFKPASGGDTYLNFQDFFIRKFRNPPEIHGSHTWPCEGLLCEHGIVENLKEVEVKKQKKDLRAVFGVGGKNIPDKYYYSNIFLHNRDYHRVHSPVKGKITRIEHIPGDLVLLRPWIYPEDPSHPALRNERYNVDITDEDDKTWFLSIVGGPAVGTIELNPEVLINYEVNAGEEIATFLLGSTCCIAIPVAIKKKVGEYVKIGEPL